MGLSAPEPLAGHHDLSGFESGEPLLDEWLRRRAAGNQASGASRSFVACDGDVVRGFYCLSAGAVALAAAPGRIRRNMPEPIPVIVLGRLAVDRAWHGQGVGRALLRDAARRAVQVSEVLGVRALMVQAMNDGARQFYAACGFVPSPVDAMLLMVVMQDLKAF